MSRILFFAVLILTAFSSNAEEPSSIVVPYGPGPGLDAVARILAKQLAIVQGAPVVVDNRPGAGTAIGTEHVYRSKADGKTMLMNASALAIGAAANSFSINPMTGLIPVIQVSDADNFLLVHGGLSIKSLDDIVAAGKTRGLNCGAVAGQYEFACRQLQNLLGGDIVTVVYKGAGEATTALSSGEVDIMFASKSMMMPMLATEKIRVIAAATATTAEAPFEYLPIVKDRWPGLVLSGLVGIYVVKGTPAETVQILNRQLNEVLNNADVKRSLKFLGLVPVGGSAVQLSEKLAHDIKFFSSRQLDSKSGKL